MVSVVVTCYNYAAYLELCVNSALNQSFPDLEVIIVNDGSTDSTAQVVTQWADDHRVHYIEQENSGQANAKNVGIQSARGEFVAFLDADDYWHPRKLEQQLRLFGDQRVGVVYSRAQYIDEQSDDISYSPTSRYLAPVRGVVTNQLIFDNFVPFSSAVVRKACFARHGPFDAGLAMAIDWDLWLRLSLDYRFDYVDEPLLYYRVGHANQMSRDLASRQQCCDRILANFLGRQPGVISDKILRQARAYTLSSRGRYFESRDRSRAVQLHLQSITCQPFQISAYKGLARLILRRLPAN